MHTYIQPVSIVCSNINIYVNITILSAWIS